MKRAPLLMELRRDTKALAVLSDALEFREALTKESSDDSLSNELLARHQYSVADLAFKIASQSAQNVEEAWEKAKHTATSAHELLMDLKKQGSLSKEESEMLVRLDAILAECAKRRENKQRQESLE